MTYFLYDGEVKTGMKFTLQGKEARHILFARRVKKEEEIVIQDSTFRRYLVKVVAKEREAVLLFPFNELTTPPEPDFRIHLYQSMVKDKTTEYIVQKATELGVTSLTLFQSDFSTCVNYRPEKKLERWHRIAWGACKQSGRLKPPPIKLIPKGTELKMEGRETIFFSLASDSLPLSRLQPEGRVLNLIIGPEGGWSQQEVAKNKYPVFHLGPRILRVDTASLAVISILQSKFGDFSSRSANYSTLL